MPTADLSIRTATADDVDVVSRILAAAFMQDPVSEWIFPDGAERARLHKSFFRHFVELTVDAGEVHLCGEGVGAALWLSAGGEVESADGGDLHSAMESSIGIEYTKRFAVLDELMTAHHPTRRHSYLPFIAAHPRHQGLGIGSALLQHQLRRLDDDGLPAYLEASCLRNAALYERHGFGQMDATLDLPQGPSLYPMWRDPA
jgi:ribosomal protein S18 acetylase RimI-like enzyme